MIGIVMTVAAQNRDELSSRQAHARHGAHVGGHGTSVEQRRARLLGVARELLCEQGVDGVSLEAIGAAAEIAPRVVRTIFPSRERCLVALLKVLGGEFSTAMQSACDREGVWLDGVRASLFELLARLDENANVARFLVLGSLGDGPEMFAHRRRQLIAIANALEERRPEAACDALAAPFGADASVNAVAVVLRGRLLEDPVPSLVDLTGSLTALLITPYLGVGAAREELLRD
jgi:AcrR family transcriptional regulator